eukprot:gene7638-7840_t
MSGRFDPDGTLRKGGQQDATASKSTSQAARGVLHATSSKKTASGMVNALISSFNGQLQHTAGNSSFMAAPGSSSSSANAKATTPVPVNPAQMTNNLVLHPRCGSAKQPADGSSGVPMASSIASAADAARVWNSHAGATSTSAPVSPTRRSFTEPGIMATQGRLSNASHLLRDAVFTPDDLSSNSAVGPKSLHSQVNSISFLQPSDNGGMTSDANIGIGGFSLMQMNSTSGGSTANSSFTTSKNASFTSPNSSFTALNSVFTAPNSSSGQDQQLYGSLRTFPASVAGNMSSSGIPIDVLRQRARVSFLLNSNNPTDASSTRGLGSRSASINRSSAGQLTAMVKSASTQLLLEEATACLSESKPVSTGESSHTRPNGMIERQHSREPPPSNSRPQMSRLASFKAVLHKLTGIGDAADSGSPGTTSNTNIKSPEKEQPLLPALPAGGVPKFGIAQSDISSGPNTLVQAASDRQNGIDIASHGIGNSSNIDRLGSAGSSATAAQALFLAQAQPAKLPVEAGLDSQTLRAAGTAAKLSQTQAQQQQAIHPSVPQPSQQPIVLAPPATTEPVLLAVAKWLPPAMQRQHWCLADFVVQKRLYDGYASTISKAQDRISGATVALKVYHMNKLNNISSHQVAREVRLHVALQHENIIKLHAAFQEVGSVVLVQEFATGGDLWAFMDTNSGRLTEQMTVSLVLQPFLRALHYLHASGIAHRDIKPENILFSGDMVLKIADFGLAVNLREERAVTRVGTLDYMAPEVLRCPLKRNPGDNKDNLAVAYQQSVDSWAVGILAFELLTGRAPFTSSGASEAAVEAAIKTAAPFFPRRLSEPAKDFMAAALNKTPDKRLNILQMLQHPWIKSFQARMLVAVQ